MFRLLFLSLYLMQNLISKTDNKFSKQSVKLEQENAIPRHSLSLTPHYTTSDPIVVYNTFRRYSVREEFWQSDIERDKTEKCFQILLRMRVLLATAVYLRLISFSTVN